MKTSNYLRLTKFLVLSVALITGLVLLVLLTTTSKAEVSSSNEAYAWGWSSFGQLGNLNYAGFSNVPVVVNQGAVPNGVTIKAVAAGGSNTLALGSDGKLYAWGYNYYGQLGNGTATPSNVPVAVSQGAIPTGVNIKAISAGGSNSLALGSDGKLYAWGFNHYGQLGNGKSGAGVYSNVPVAVSQGAVPNGVTFTAISAGGGHNLALGSDGKLYAWGDNSYRELGNMNYGGFSNVPVAVSQGAVPNGITIKAISAGDNYSLALGSDGKLYAWGVNYYGQLGNGTTTDSNVPVAVNQGEVPNGVTFTAIAARGSNSLALGSDGKLYAWGSNGFGQLGNGTGTDSNVPVAVSQGAVPTGVTFTAISAGGLQSLALGSDGKLYAWGRNSNGQLGNGTYTDSNVPIAVSQGAAPTGITIIAISARGTNSLALGSDGKLYAWGSNGVGELGNGTTSYGNILPDFYNIWKQSDLAVANGQSNKSWLWGPDAFATKTEGYKEAKDGQRQVQYLDKARMEINNPDGDRANLYFVTNGLLPKELIGGYLQTGDATTIPKAPAEVNVAGDPGGSVTYAKFAGVTTLAPGQNTASDRTGQPVTARIDRNGVVSEGDALSGVTLSQFISLTGHNIPNVFVDYFKTLPQDWLFVMGYPLSEPYITDITLAGKPTTVLVQVFERRVLTYTPSNPDPFKVEQGNVGRHYYQWRYGS